MNKEFMKQLGYREDFDENNRIVKQEDIAFKGNKYFVSTIDLGLDHGFDGYPLYFETMIFPTGEWGDMYCDRYANRETALQKHVKLVDDINNGKYEIKDGYFEEVENE